MKPTPMALTLFALSFVLACSKDSKDSTGHDSAPPTDSGSMGGGPCGEVGICPIAVENAEVTGCDIDTGLASELAASFNSTGGLDVVHTAAQMGCSPEFSAEAELSLRNDTLLVNYNLANDFCDCICNLNLAYTLTGIPEGIGFNLNANGVSLVVEGR